MASHLDIKLKKIRKELDERMPGPKPSTLEEFLASSYGKLPEASIVDLKRLFRDIFVFYRTTKERTEPDIILWIYIRDVMLDQFREHGDNSGEEVVQLLKEIRNELLKEDLSKIIEGISDERTKKRINEATAST